MAGKPWTPEEEAALRQYAGGIVTPESVAQTHPGRSYHAVIQRALAMGVQTQGMSGKLRHLVPTMTRVVSETPERTVIAPEETDEEPIEELLARTFRATDRATQKAGALRMVEVNVVCNGRPVGLSFASDQHLSTSEPVFVRRAFDDAETIQQTPGLYAVLGGDGADNHIKHRAALVNKRSSPSDEWRLYDHYLRTLGSKALAVISGNHDDWTKDFSGVDMVGILTKRHAIHYAPDELLLRVRLLDRAPKPGEEPEGQVYTVKIRHQYRFGSSLNLGHTVKRMYDMGGDPFDVGVVCHNHEAAVESFDRHGLTRWALRPGSYQHQTSYGRRFGYNPSHPTCPTVILWPGERRLVALPDLRDAVDYLAHARKEAQAA